jgi:hypothetical protein
MTESQVVNEWIRQGEARGELNQGRRVLLKVLNVRFPGSVTDEIARFISGQDSSPLLDDWFLAALRANTYEQFLDVLKH